MDSSSSISTNPDTERNMRTASLASPTANHVLTALLVAVALALPACHRDQPATPGDASGTDAATLPKPESDGGSVTGMPDAPGPGAVGPPPASDGDIVLPADTTVASGDILLPGDDVQPATPGDPPALPGLPAEPAAADAVAVVRAYYAAINEGQYPRAYALWSGGGSASGQSAEQFAGGFADTAQVVVEPGEPGRVDAAAGSRYVEVPVSIRATRDDGSVHRYAGSYVLRRAVVDGATAEQRAWRIASADLREVE
jgi:hypothetical protein